MVEVGEESVYDRVGGMPWFHDLCTRFYRRVADDEVLRPLYPDDLEPSRYWLALFLAQYWEVLSSIQETGAIRGYECVTHIFGSDSLSEIAGMNT